jgi:drug/metabolite transporter (DMT)-like permease
LFFKRPDNKRKSILLSVFSGCMGGLTMVFFNMAMRELFNWNIKNMPVDVLILYILAAVLGAAAEQASYRIGEMKVVAVVRLSFYIIYPVLGSILLFNIRADIIQFLAIAALILSCYGIFKKR